MNNGPHNSDPCVSVVMPVYNGGLYLSEAIESILNQTWGDFEFIIIDDGSTDDSWQQLNEYAKQDSRISLVSNRSNLGLIQSLNKGISLAKGKYIARMDADDISLPNRLATQVTYLDRHLHIGILGTAYFRQYEDGKRALRQPPVTDTEIRWRLLFDNVWCHPTIMFRRQLMSLEQPFYRKFLHAEDYELWIRLLKHTCGATVTTPLLIYRMHSSSVCATNSEQQNQMVTDISTQQIKHLLSTKITRTEIASLRRCYQLQHQSCHDMNYCSYLFELFEAFAQQPQIKKPVVQRLRRRWIKRMIHSLPAYNKSDLKLFQVALYHEPLVALWSILVHLPRQVLRPVLKAWNIKSRNEGTLISDGTDFKL